jgi:8-oxo-dGTP pyrophosphatase MutT (NUDIX family)
MDLSIVYDDQGLRRQVIEVLEKSPLDYLTQVEFLKKEENGSSPWERGGVLLPISFSGEPRMDSRQKGEYVFLLSKRSKRIPQGGDLCAPGGRIHLFWDSIFQRLLQTGFLPGTKEMRLRLARSRERKLYELILFFWSNALRESWEELRLNPFNVEFLGPLTTYRLQSRRWIIFPLVGRIKNAWQPKISWEVEKVIAIPFKAFFQPEQYAICKLENSEETSQENRRSREFPCLIIGEKGKEEILWGATYNIIRQFLNLVIDQPLPSPDGQRVIHRPMALNYYTGSREGRKGLS